LGTEADSPRGRIYLMTAISSGEMSLDHNAIGHLDGCLGCLACETACPSGVSYRHRIEEFRPRIHAAVRRNPWRRIVAAASADPRLLRFALRVARVMDTLGLARLRRRLPGLDLLPAARAAYDGVERTPRSRSRIPAPEQPRMRVGLLAGCVGDALRPSINRAAVEVLHRNGIEVVEIEDIGCCGALAMHAGRESDALELARRNARAFADAGVERFVTTAAGCGAMLRDYGRLLRNDADHCDAARRMAANTRDVSELLVEAGFARPSRQPLESKRVVYHDACHLLHASGIADAPRSVVSSAIGRRPTDLGDNMLCCGSAGSYNIDHRAMGLELGRHKAALARDIGADVISVGNIGCILQLERAAALEGIRVRVAHPVELLAEAYDAKE